MSSPTHYHLIFKANNCGEYDVYEQHTCTQKGCLWTEEKYVGETCIPGNEAKFAEEYNNKLKEQDGVVVSYEIKGFMEVEQ